MRIDKSNHRTAALRRGAALIVLSSLAAGCSSNVSRFTETTLFTGSTENQRAIIDGDTKQPYPGDVAQPARADAVYTGSVHRGALEPVDLTRSATSRVNDTSRVRAADEPVSLLKPAGEVRTTDPVETGTVAKPAAETSRNVDETGEGGWTATGGTRVTLREGETIYNLSRRFGVPADAIMSANGIKDATSVAAGTNIVIPTYVYSRSVGVSAPDNNPKVANASAGRGERTEEKKKAPDPAHEPDRQAVLPAASKPRERTNETAASEAKPAKSEAEKGSIHKVVAGDTLYDIARKYGTTADALKQANELSSGLIRIGQELRLPGVGGTVIADASKDIDPIVTGTAGPAVGKTRKTNELPQYTPPTKKQPGEVIEEAKVDAGETPQETGIGKLRWPARGRVIAAYGSVNGGRKNDGIDIAVPSGTPVKAAENGVVIYAGDGLKEFGNTVLVRHEDGLVTVYGHASSILVSRGDKVRRGQEIARSGMSGTADVPKLHFEVRDKSVPVDPTGYLQ